jgi:hypothetical protein
MDSAIFTQSFVNEVLRLLQDETRFKKESISFEIQDDYKFLLISISIDDFPEDESLSSLKNVGHLLNRFIPGRRGDYSWMVNFTKKGKVFNSYFGGDLDNPNSGL